MTPMWNRIISVALILLLGASSGCTGGKRPFLMIQLCIGDEKHVVLFKEMMRSIAQKQNMKYIDGSVATQKDLAATKVALDYRLIYVGIDGPDGIAVEGGNLGLSAYDVALGFSEGSNPMKAHRFANLVVGKLRAEWQVHIVPPNRGAFPMKSCGS